MMTFSLSTRTSILIYKKNYSSVRILYFDNEIVEYTYLYSDTELLQYKFNLKDDLLEDDSPVLNYLSINSVSRMTYLRLAVPY
jgi:hypothetical protein